MSLFSFTDRIQKAFHLRGGISFKSYALCPLIPEFIIPTLNELELHFDPARHEPGDSVFELLVSANPILCAMMLHA
jgi:hypothetical protein